MKGNTLISAEVPLKQTSVYAGFLLLKIFEKKEKVSIYEAYAAVSKSQSDSSSYASTMNGLLFLYALGLIEFKPPYFKKVEQK